MFKTVKQLLFVGALTFIFILGVFPAITRADMVQDQINSLLSQISALQQKLAQFKKVSDAPWCHAFNINLKSGDTTGDVVILQMALKKEGLGVNQSGVYDKQTVTAVAQFQEKYMSEVLAPKKLKHGTGFTGPLTRAKLNALYQCVAKATDFTTTSPSVAAPDQTPAPSPIPPAHASVPLPVSITPTPGGPSVAIISPAGGEDWEVQETHDITWTSSNISSTANLDIYLLNVVTSEVLPLATVKSGDGSYSWNIDLPLSFIDENNDQYKIEIAYLGTTYAVSNAFTINATPALGSLFDITKQTASIFDAVSQLIKQMKK